MQAGTLKHDIRPRSAAGPSVSVCFTASADDLAAAYRRHHLALLCSRRMLLTIGLSVVAVMAAVAYVSGGDWRGAAVAGAAGAIGGVAVQLGLIAWRVPAAARRIYRQQRSLHTEITATFDADGLRLVTPMADARTPWSHYRRWREDGRVLLLYHSDLLFQFLPTRVLRAGELDRIRAFAAAAGVPGASPDDADDNVAER